MLKLRALLILGGLMTASTLLAQPPEGERKGDRPAPRPEGNPVERMMSFDKNKDGKLSKEEVTDERLLRMFERADANKDGVVTKEELTALFAQEKAIGEGARGRDRGPGDRGPGDRGGPGMRMMGRPGQVMPPFLQETLRLSEKQREQIEAIQKEVDEKLGKILNEEQRRMLREMRERGPGGNPGEGRPGRFGEGRPGDRPGRPGEGRPGEGRPGGERPEGERRPQ